MSRHAGHDRSSAVKKIKIVQYVTVGGEGVSLRTRWKP